jgi:hypothetical protein
LDRGAPEHPSDGLVRALESTIDQKGAISEKLEEASYFTIMHGSTEIRAHQNLTRIKVFGPRLPFDYGSTSIIETL